MQKDGKLTWKHVWDSAEQVWRATRPGNRYDKRGQDVAYHIRAARKTSLEAEAAHLSDSILLIFYLIYEKSSQLRDWKWRPTPHRAQ